MPRLNPTREVENRDQNVSPVQPRRQSQPCCAKDRRHVLVPERSSEAVIDARCTLEVRDLKIILRAVRTEPHLGPSSPVRGTVGSVCQDRTVRKMASSVATYRSQACVAERLGVNFHPRRVAKVLRPHACALFPSRKRIC